MSRNIPPESGAELTYGDWRAGLEEGTLLGLECASCGHRTASPKAACIACGARDLDTVTLPTDGIVHSETTIAVAPTGFEGPYQVAIVDLGDVRLLARIDGEADIGDSVTFAGGTDDSTHPAPVFEPEG